LVKEADALTATGYEVAVVGAFGGDWAIDADRSLLPSKPWPFDLIDWRRERQPALFWKSRIRQRVLRPMSAWPGAPIGWVEGAVTRPGPELARGATRHPADLYIAHNLGALPAAARAARAHGARLGFDAEDYHAGQFADEGADEAMKAAVLRLERHYVPACDSITAAAPGIAEAYRSFSRCGLPPCVLNVGSLTERPSASPPPTSRTGPLTLYWFSQTIGPDRGLEDVVRAMGQMRDAPIELHLRGNWASGYESRLRDVAREAGARAESIDAQPPAPPADMVRLAARHDVGLALEPGATANNRIAVSNKAFTYLLAGVAVIATKTPGQQWLMDQMPDAGWVYRPGDVPALVALLRSCLEDRSRVAAARAAAWEYGTTRFNWEIEATAFLNVVAGVFAGASRRQPAVGGRQVSAATGTHA